LLDEPKDRAVELTYLTLHFGRRARGPRCHLSRLEPRPASAARLVT
jgi:hypothetical protein